ncbi:MAG TPA: type II toxin-antitoxin system antitoxin SocA domain-containing protein [Bacteroidia bacterium]|nr:type II toxin-antitoxin system antitoxin SocA domain-containing protein [Bacteroidia bacterium]
MYSAEVISAWFVNKGIDTGNFITQMKLQKVIYFANGLCLALEDKPLVNERFRAWRYGPVIPEIYSFYKKWGSAPITMKTKIGVEQDGIKLFNLDVFPDNIENILNLTWSATKNVSGEILSGWTHEKGAPWSQHYDEGANNVIPDMDIKKYFKEKVIKS